MTLGSPEAGHVPRIVASIEARMGSSRLPGKVLADIGGRPALTRLLDRLRQTTTLHDIVLATSVQPADDILEDWAKTNDVFIHRGSEADVLRRVLEAHLAVESDVIVEITGDCVFIDPELVDMVVSTFLHNDCDVVTNAWRRSYPDGMDVQVFRRSALEEVDATIDDPAVREHVSPYFYEHPERYRVVHLLAPARWSAPDTRIVLDYPEDLYFLRELWNRLAPSHANRFGIEEMMELLRQEPTLLDINRHCETRPLR
jgi:spore coat polysaccharide biosynthesis protein SpsF